uniref:Reverse transcriptase/retrotransposon-derived protein RNase H-like domain-containing protein n=1 Tax=Panagrolaimus sp. JU765 TaxID=591449 RepID=A0AC34RGY1_9BILA
MVEPQNLEMLESYIGFVNYYGKYVKNLANLMAPLNELRKQGAELVWTDVHKKGFEKIKDELLNSEWLIHYDPTRPVYLATDASEYGIGAEISHRDADGRHRVIANASRKLTSAEINYAQIEKEEFAYADGLSRLPDPNEKPSQVELDSINWLELQDGETRSPFNLDLIRAETAKDKVLNTVLGFTRTGWPEKSQKN